MSYLLKSKPKQENKTKFFVIVVVFALLSLSNFFFSGALKTVSHAIAKPVWAFSGYASKPFGSITDFFRFKNSLITRNTVLEEEVNSLKLKEIDYDLLLKENEDLRSQLGIVNNSFKISSKVLSKPPRSPYDTLVIDSGSSAGVAPGNRVYLSDGVVIGFVTNVTPSTSLVKLFSTGDNTQEAVVSRTGTSFNLVGNGGANFKLEVPKDTDIVWGDTFLYPSNSAAIIGNVYYIDQNSQSSFKTIHIRIPGNVFSSQWVFVEKNP